MIGAGIRNYSRYKQCVCLEVDELSPYHAQRKIIHRNDDCMETFSALMTLREGNTFVTTIHLELNNSKSHGRRVDILLLT